MTDEKQQATTSDEYDPSEDPINSLMVENEDLAQLLYKAHTTPQSLTGSDLDRTQSWLLMNYDSFRRQTLAHQAGLLPDALYEQQKAGIGFVFVSDAGFELIDLFRASAMDDKTWEAISASAKEARKYCLNPANRCMARYEAARENGP